MRERSKEVCRCPRVTNVHRRLILTEFCNTKSPPPHSPISLSPNNKPTTANSLPRAQHHHGQAWRPPPAAFPQAKTRRTQHAASLPATYARIEQHILLYKPLYKARPRTTATALLLLLSQKAADVPSQPVPPLYFDKRTTCSRTYPRTYPTQPHTGSSCKDTPPPPPPPSQMTKDKFPPTARFVNMTQLYATGAHNMPDEDRVKVMNGLSKPVTEAKAGDLGFGDIESMTAWEEFVAIIFLLVIVGSMLWIPVALMVFILCVRSLVAWVVMLTVFFALSLHPVPRIHDMVHSPLNHFIFKYFSLKMASDAPIDSSGQYIFVAPPHGVLPMGNLMTVHAMKASGGL